MTIELLLPLTLLLVIIVALVLRLYAKALKRTRLRRELLRHRVDEMTRR